MNTGSVSSVSSNGDWVTFPKFMASISFDIDQILEVVFRNGSDLEDKESWEVCFEDQASDLESLNDVLSQVGSFVGNRSDL